MGSSRAVRVYFVIILSFFCIVLLAPARAWLANAPVLLTKTNSTRAVAVESSTLLAEPFPTTAPIAYGQDHRTRVTLYASNLTLLPGETAANVTATAEDGNHILYPLTVEYVGSVPNLAGMTSVVVRLHDSLGDVGDVLVGITVHGLTSNRVRIGIGHIGGGPPDDAPVAQATPELGAGASLHGKQVFPFDNAWNQDVSNSQVDPNSDNLIAGMAYVAPARHWASTNTSVDRPPMGMRVRLKASVDISGYSPAMQVILRALKKYGMILADNGSNWFISGAPDPRWNDDDLNTLKGIKGSNFEVVKMDNIVTP